MSNDYFTTILMKIHIPSIIEPGAVGFGNIKVN